MAQNKSACEWEALFKKLDKDGSGYLEIAELRDLLRSSGKQMSDQEICKAFMFFDSGGDKKISLAEFKKGIDVILNFEREITKVFNQFDTDGSGFLEKEELATILRNCYPNITDDCINDIIKEADSSNDGKISLKEFLAVVQK